MSENQNKDYENQINRLKKRVNDLEAKETRLNEELSYRCQSIKHLEVELEQAIESNNRCKKKLDLMQINYDNVVKKQYDSTVSSQSQLCRLQEEKDKLEHELKCLESEKVKLDLENSQLDERKRYYEDTVQKIEQELKDYKETCQHLKHNLEYMSFINLDNEKLQIENADLLRELEIYKSKIISYELKNNVKYENSDFHDFKSTKSSIQSPTDHGSISSNTALGNPKSVSSQEKAELKATPSPSKLLKSKLSNQVN
ncbi:hypothetical protein K502DRAFT_340332 [Neoconidiobolus thromboides FSU 785]|nr:hypothetical protein K502DRAFT_340332 [Neoconidiobolus thromboides FSU 785]